ncbi:MAG: hypothetical protein J5944_13940, partial [Lentisphaeria bacterium]|nr:hypothetical protein [Lentisphaeria bacterium]
VLDNLPQHCHIMLLRTHDSILRLVEKKKVVWVLFFVKSEKFYGISVKMRQGVSRPGFISSC